MLSKMFFHEESKILFIVYEPKRSKSLQKAWFGKTNFTPVHLEHRIYVSPN